MKVNGQCYCGNIQYEAEVDPERVVICHCTDCQQLSGSAFRTVAFTREDAFESKGGAIKEFIKTAASGNRRAQGFCGECGSAIYATSVGEGPKTYGLRVGTLAQRRQLKPRRQVWQSSALDWVGTIEDLPAVDKQPA